MSATSALAQDESALVFVQTVEEVDIRETIPLAGTVASARVSALSAEIAGKVTRVDVDSGSHVESGETLVELDSALVRLSERQAAAAVREAEAELTDAQRRFGIAERLAGQSTLSENELRARRTEVEVDTAVLERLQAEREVQAYRLARHAITAPFPGAVARRLTEVGAWVEPGTAVVELVDMQNLRIDVPVPQEHFQRLSEGTEVSVRFDAIPDQSFAARFQSLVPVSETTARTFLARVVLTGDAPSLMPGMSAQVTFRLPTGEQHAVIPRDGLVRYPDGRTVVWVVEEDGDVATVAEREVELGLAFDGMFQVRSGLSAGERVVVVGNETLSPGQPVRFKEGGT
ncbi:MAG: efflux RND transporter periplasmic adaptor subunit [Roseovarius sp.]